MFMKHCGHFATHGSVKEEKAVSRNGLLFADMHISEHEGTWGTHNAVTNEAREDVRYNNIAQVRLFSTV